MINVKSVISLSEICREQKDKGFDTVQLMKCDFLNLIDALKEAKEIMESDIPESAQYKRWLSRYFPDTRKEEV